MSFLSVLIGMGLCFAILELLADGYPRMQRQIFYIAMVVIAVWCTAKYAYGPDIKNYIPFYANLRGPSYDLSHMSRYYFEPGFVVFCSVLKGWGFTFWMMTAVISVLYFTSLTLVLRELEEYRTLALMMVVFLDNNLILSEFRQCLAVSLYIFFILLIRKRKYIWSLVPLLLCVTMHKSALLIVFFTILFHLLRGINVQRVGYLLLSLLIVGLLFFPLMSIFEGYINQFAISSDMQSSLLHHIKVGKLFQRVFLLYVFTILLLAYYKQDASIDKRRHWLMWCCVAVIVCLYPYWFLLNRLRSYFLPFLVVYVIRTVRQKDIKDVLPRQLYTAFLILYVAVFLIQIPSKNALLRYPTDNISLVFERRYHSEAALQSRQMRQAKMYWKYDYKKMINSGMQK